MIDLKPGVTRLKKEWLTQGHSHEPASLKEVLEKIALDEGYRAFDGFFDGLRKGAGRA